MSHLLRVILALVFSVAAVGCAHSGFTRTASFRMPPRESNCYVDIILSGTPVRPYIVLGRVTTDSTAPGIFALGETEDAALSRLRQAACAAGAHFVLDVQTGSEGEWTGDGYSRSTRGAATVGVYVTPGGTPLPPPTGPQDVVHMPSGVVYPGQPY